MAKPKYNFWSSGQPHGEAKWQKKVFTIIYESNTYWGKFFDVSLLIAIILSILVVMFDSIPEIHGQYGSILLVFEWAFTILFSIEYVLRIISIKVPKRYIFSFLGIIDLLAILPTFLSLFFIGTQYLLVIRSLRLLRVFRIFKMIHFLDEIKTLGIALYFSLRKISVFLLAVVLLVIILGSVMYLVEGGANGFDSIPSCIYWGVVTITTVGYGDIVPTTVLGKFIATVMMLTGYSIIAVPTGIVTVELAKSTREREKRLDQVVCNICSNESHEFDAKYCKRCGSKLNHHPPS
jgi:voltage-gated potassium channel